MKFILYSSFLLLLAPCNASKKSTVADAPSPKAGGPKTILITFERTVCFGKCPVFTLTISAETNKATYVGTSNVSKLGTFEKTFSDEEIAKLKSEFDKAKFFDMEDEYSSPITDVPTTYVSLSVNGTSKKIKDVANAPAQLRQLEKTLDDIANSEGWEKVKEKE